jgi:serine protease Do
LGVSGLSVTPEIAEYYKLHAERGALVADVMRNSPARKAGLERGDIIVAFGEKAISTIDELVHEVAKRRAGERVRLTVVRGVEKYAVDVMLERTP